MLLHMVVEHCHVQGRLTRYSEAGALSHRSAETWGKPQV